MRPLIFVFGLLVAVPAFAFQSGQPSDTQVRQAIIHDSIAAYQSTGHPCACPYNADRAGHSCGRRSAYSRPGGAAPLCYPNDVTAGMVQDWRAQHL